MYTSARLLNDPKPARRPGSSSTAALLSNAWYPRPPETGTKGYAEYSGQKYPHSDFTLAGSGRKYNRGQPLSASKENLRHGTVFSSPIVDMQGSASQFGRAGFRRSQPWTRTGGTWSDGKMNMSFNIKLSSPSKR